METVVQEREIVHSNQQLAIGKMSSRKKDSLLIYNISDNNNNNNEKIVSTDKGLL